jgi:hypothetical protein
VRSLIAAAVAIVMLAPLDAAAADLPLAVPGPAVYAPPAAYRAAANWGGFYVGGNSGVDLARDKSTFSVGGVQFATVDTAVFGAAGGAQAGNPARWSWARRAISTGAMPKAASAPSARSVGR